MEDVKMKNLILGMFCLLVYPLTSQALMLDATFIGLTEEQQECMLQAMKDWEEVILDDYVISPIFIRILD